MSVLPYYPLLLLFPLFSPVLGHESARHSHFLPSATQVHPSRWHSPPHRHRRSTLSLVSTADSQHASPPTPPTPPSYLASFFSRLTCREPSETSIASVSTGTSASEDTPDINDWRLFCDASSFEPESSPHSPGYSLRPLFMLHGFLSTPEDLSELRCAIKRQYRQKPVFLLQSVASRLGSLHQQTQDVVAEIRGIISAHPNLFTDRYDLLCHSQGGVICRAAIMQMDDHRVHTFVSTGSPHLGVYGRLGANVHSGMEDPQFRVSTQPNRFFSSLMYSGAAQKTSSIANLWHDPRNADATYLAGNTFLPRITENVSERGAQNFCRVQKIAVFGSRDDGMIEPWTSTVWGFVTPNGVVFRHTESPLFTAENDILGLRAMTAENRFLMFEIPGVEHRDWVREEDVYMEHIIPLFQ